MTTVLAYTPGWPTRQCGLHDGPHEEPAYGVLLHMTLDINISFQFWGRAQVITITEDFEKKIKSSRPTLQALYEAPGQEDQAAGGPQHGQIFSGVLVRVGCV